MHIRTLTLTMGEENLSPHRYEGFRVGPISITIELGPEDTVAEATRVGLAALKPAYDKVFLVQRDKYHEHHALKG